MDTGTEGLQQGEQTDRKEIISIYARNYLPALREVSRRGFYWKVQQRIVIFHTQMAKRDSDSPKAFVTML